MSTTADTSAYRPRRRRKKPEPTLPKQPLNDEQRALFRHLASWTGPDISVIYPQVGMFGEIQAIAVGFDPAGQVMLRLDRVPPMGGVPFTLALRAAFQEFPTALWLQFYQWSSKPSDHSHAS